MSLRRPQQLKFYIGVTQNNARQLATSISSGLCRCVPFCTNRVGCSS
jgi:hypothetical protein